MKNSLKFMIVCVLIIIMASGCISRTFPEENMSDEGQVTISQTFSNDDVIKDKIRSNLIGTQIIYYDIRGKAVTYNITKKDIKSIEKTSLEGSIVWKVRIGEGLAWNYYYDEQGNEIIKKEQLFRT